MPLSPWLRLLRVGTLFSPAADVVAGLCIAGAPWSPHAVRAVTAGACLYAAGMVLNDWSDRRQDALQRPERPLPRGEIRPGAALALGLLLLLAGVSVSPARAWHAGMAALVVGYDFWLKRSPVVGALAMGALRALNLATAAALAEPPPGALQDLLAAALAYAAYIVAVTLLGVLEDAPNVRSKVVRSLLAVPPLSALAALFAAQDGIWPAPALAAAPILLFAARNRRVAAWDRPAIRGAMTWLLLGTMLYTALLCVARGRWVEAAAIAAAVGPARWIARRIALT